MQKPDCSCSCDFPLTREVTILGTKVQVKNYICARDDGPYRKKPEKVRLQLSILPTGLCNAHCPFCIAAPADDPRKLDPDRLKPVLERLRDEDVVRGVTVTGGEPCLDMPFLDCIIRMVFDVFGPGIQVTLDTNGTGLHRLRELRDLYRIDAIHISRHHWDDEVNNRIFGRTMPTAEELRDAFMRIGCRDLFVLNCVLLKDAVSTPEDVHRYLDFAIGTGAGKAAFITAASVNSWTAEHRVRFDDVLRDDDPQLLFTREYRDFSWCRCRDGVYVSPDGRIIEFYGRLTEAGSCEYCRGFAYGPDNLLRAGFHGAIVGQA